MLRLAWLKFAPRKSAFTRYALDRSAPLKSTSVRSCNPMFNSDKLQPLQVRVPNKRCSSELSSAQALFDDKAKPNKTNHFDKPMSVLPLDVKRPHEFRTRPILALLNTGLIKPSETLFVAV